MSSGQMETTLQDDNNQVLNDDDGSGSEKSFVMNVTLAKPESFDFSPVSKTVLRTNGPTVLIGPSPGLIDEVGSLVSTNSNVLLSRAGETTLCMGCEDEGAVLYCRQCAANYCSACDKQTHVLKNRQSHIRVAPQQGRSEPAICSFHQSQSCEFFCNSCNQAICVLCKDYGSHRTPEHDIIAVRLVADEARAVLLANVEQIQALLESSSIALKQIDQSLADLMSGNAAACARGKISTFFDILEEEAGKRRAALKAEIDEDGDWKQNGLSHQQELLQSIVHDGVEVQGVCKNALEEGKGHCDLTEALEIVETFFATANPVLRYTDPVEKSPIDTQLDEAINAEIFDVGSVGGPMNVQFQVLNDGHCLLSWSPPMAAHELATGNYETTLVAYEITLSILLPGAEVATSVDLGSRSLAMDEDVLTVLTISVDLREYVSSSVGFKLRAVYGSGRYSAWASSPSLQQLPDQFVRKNCEMLEGGKPFNTAGLFYTLGTDFLTSPYMNPHVTGAVSVSWSSTGSADIKHFVAHTNPNDFSYTLNNEYSWMAVDIGEGREFRPTGYSLRHDLQGPRGALRNWALQARTRSGDWVVLSTHKNDLTLPAEAGSEVYIELPPRLDEKGYRHFRIVQTGVNSSGKNRMSCAGFELYGVLC